MVKCLYVSRPLVFRLFRLFTVFLHRVKSALRLLVVGTRHVHGLPGRRNQKSRQGLLIRGIVEHVSIDAQRCLSVLLGHKSQESSQLCKELFLVDFVHLLFRTYTDIILKSSFTVKGNLRMPLLTSLEAEYKIPVLHKKAI